MNFFLKHWSVLLESIANQTKYALIPGSFRPPHKGHYAMFKYYSDLVGPEGKAIIIISDPQKAKRLTSEGKPISAETTEQIIKLYCKNLPNVSIIISQAPVKTCYDFGEQVAEGTLIFGCSKKDDDLKRFRAVKKYVEEHYPNLYVIDPQTTAADTIKVQGTNVSASDFRAVFDDRDKMKAFIPDHLSDSEKEEVINLLLA